MKSRSIFDKNVQNMWQYIIVEDIKRFKSDQIILQDILSRRI
jgi:hypothetical protein